MHKAIRIVAASFGAFAGFGGIEHGIFEIMQGNVAPAGVAISSIGPPCVPELAWNVCEPAMTPRSDRIERLRLGRATTNG